MRHYIMRPVVKAPWIPTLVSIVLMETVRVVIGGSHNLFYKGHVNLLKAKKAL